MEFVKVYISGSLHKNEHIIIIIIIISLLVGVWGIPPTNIYLNSNLADGFNPFEKHERQIGHLSQVGVKIKEHLKPPPSNSSQLEGILRFDRRLR